MLYTKHIFFYSDAGKETLRSGFHFTVVLFVEYTPSLRKIHAFNRDLKAGVFSGKENS